MALGWSLMGTWATIEMESSSKRKRSRKLTSSWFGKFSESSLVEHTSNGSYQSVIHSKNWSFFLPPIEIRNPVSITKYSSTTICQKMPLKKHKKHRLSLPNIHAVPCTNKKNWSSASWDDSDPIRMVRQKGGCNSPKRKKNSKILPLW